MAVKILPPIEYLRECFDLNEETGELTWKVRPEKHFKRKQDALSWNMRLPGKTVGTKNKTDRVITQLNGKKIKTHRIVYKLVNGHDPEADIDHQDKQNTNNRPRNLRLASKSQNMSNSRRSCGVIPYRGVTKRYKDKERFNAGIWIKRAFYYMGPWSLPEEAHAAYCIAKLHFRKEFADFGPNSSFTNFPLTTEFINKIRVYITKAKLKMRLNSE
jgi:hypothetical protein